MDEVVFVAHVIDVGDGGVEQVDLLAICKSQESLDEAIAAYGEQEGIHWGGMNEYKEYRLERKAYPWISVQEAILGEVLL